MSVWVWVAIVAGAALLVVLAANVVRVVRHPRVARVTIVDPEQSTTWDPSGKARSVQAADLVLPTEALDAIWTPMHLERLARTYWRFLTRVTLGLIRIAYTSQERMVVLLVRPFVLLRFQAPEYEMDDQHGLVRWRIERGVLVARRGRGGDGYLEIEIERRPCGEPGMACAHVTIEVANFYPMIASTFSRPVYRLTQSFIHVLVTHAFLRSLARLDLAPSRTGRFEGVADLLSSGRR
ncbi:MAG TPA: hypothetical protein VH231_09690 [Solirubrobacteraceae bacterium]|jgi:hypothetical protein|nr:hypothetical protein [Solirubrobacteraceae bacterium]